MEVLAKVERYAREGFRLFEGDDRPVRHEGDGVFRIGQRDELFRLIGFYETDARHDFIIIDSFLKTGQALTPAQRERISTAARVKRDRLWRRRPDERFPRLAE